MGEQLGFQLFGPFVQLVVVVTIHHDTERTGSFAYIVAESLVLQTVDLPAPPPQFKCFADDFAFQCVRETAPFTLFRKIDADTGLACAVDVCLELSYFFEGAEIGFHPAHQGIHLWQGRPVRERCADRQDRFFVAGEVTSFINFLYEQA